jgi:cytosine/adenosine deaminase-related metal-dependent hydrolase
MILEGTILRGRTFEAVEGRVVVEDGEIEAIEETDSRSDDVILPTFVNAHTHVGDAIAKEAGRGLTLEALVAPPDGLKHRLLAEADRDDQVEAIRRSLTFMAETGTIAHLDFREGGVEGVEVLADAARSVPIDPVVLARESVAAMEAGDGFGASGANDGDFSRQRNATKRAGKLFGIHAGEGDSSDINGALDLDPDFLVHVVHPDDLHLERIADSEIPVVCCPRSNLVTGAGVPPIRDLHDRTTVALGTDNVMLNSPSMFREMEFAAKLADVTAPEVLAMATYHGAELAGRRDGLIEPGRPANLQILDGGSDNLAGAVDIVRAVVRRAGAADVREVVRAGREPPRA